MSLCYKHDYFATANNLNNVYSMYLGWVRNKRKVLYIYDIGKTFSFYTSKIIQIVISDNIFFTLNFCYVVSNKY